MIFCFLVTKYGNYHERRCIKTSIRCEKTVFFFTFYFLRERRNVDILYLSGMISFGEMQISGELTK